ncbi:MAG: hypothetical protein AAFQ51_06535, partial [Pseudomonadota bacterium]
MGCVILALSLTRVIQAQSGGSLGSGLLNRAARHSVDETYVFDDSKVISATHGERGYGGLATLVERFGTEFERALRDMIGQGTPFSLDLADLSGHPYRVRGMPVGPNPVLWVWDLGKWGEGPQESRAPPEPATPPTLDALADAPILAWAEDASGALVWSNDRDGTAFEALREALADDTAGRIRVGGGDAARWYDVTTITRGAGIRIRYATPVDALVSAEQALGRFLETLTETFAHLPIGLAI